VNPEFDVVEALYFAIEASTMNFTSSWSLPNVLAMKWKVGSSI